MPRKTLTRNEETTRIYPRLFNYSSLSYLPDVPRAVILIFAAVHLGLPRLPRLPHLGCTAADGRGQPTSEERTLLLS